MSVTQVMMPQMGEGVHEATLVKWLKKKGDPVKKGEPLLEVSTDKVDTEIPSPTDGFVVHTLAQEGAVIVVNELIAVIAADRNADVPIPEKSSSPKQSSAPKQ